jgi:N-hydroxyarylamine O-acetyltransferase
VRVNPSLARIGLDGPAELPVLMLAQLRTVPFENLSIHLGEPISLDPDDLYTKIVERRRGGFCYELNGLFAELLTALGHRVELLQARAWGGEAYGPPFDHMALRVDGDLLADVGFGRFAEFPLRLDERGDQGGFRVTEAGDDLVVTRDGVPEYRLDRRAYALADFVPTCWWQSTSPASHFTRSMTCSRSTPDGRVTISGDRLLTTAGGERTERTLAGDDEIRAAYAELFGMDLPRLPRIAA